MGVSVWGYLQQRYPLLDGLDDLTDACRLSLTFVGELQKVERICETGDLRG